MKFHMCHTGISTKALAGPKQVGSTQGNKNTEMLNERVQ